MGWFNHQPDDLRKRGFQETAYPAFTVSLLWPCRWRHGGCMVMRVGVGFKTPPKDGTFDGQDPVEQLGLAKNTVNHVVRATLACAFLVTLLAASFWEGSSWVGSGSFKQSLVWHIRGVRYEFPRLRTISVYISAPYVWEDPENCLEWEIQVTCERPAFSFGYWLGSHSPIHVWYLYLHLVAFLWYTCR